MPTLVHYIPIVTTLLAVPFSLEIFRRWRQHPDRLHLLWWAIGVAVYGVGTFTEAWTTLFGWSPIIFRSRYISGALLGGAPLAQGTVYLLLKRRTAHVLTAALLLLRPGGVGCRRPGAHRPGSWSSRTGSPAASSAGTGSGCSARAMNLDAVVFLIGGAVLSALRYSLDPGDPSSDVRQHPHCHRRDPARRRRHRDTDGTHRGPVCDGAHRAGAHVDGIPPQHPADHGAIRDSTARSQLHRMIQLPG